MPESDVCKLSEAIKKKFIKKFPDSRISTKFSTNLLPVLIINITLAKNASECKNGFSLFDPMFHELSIYGFDKDGAIIDTLQVDGSAAGLKIKAAGSDNKTEPIEGLFRGFSGDKTRIIRGFSSYFDKIHKTVTINQRGVQELVPFNVAVKLG